MTFTSSIFLIGLFPCFAIIYIFMGIKKNMVNARKVLIIFANTIFYISWGIGAFFFLCLYSLIVYLLVIIGSKHHKRWVFILSISIVLAPLIFVKYSSFAIESINSVLACGIIAPSIITPIGISFFSFEAISLLVDIYNREKTKINLVDVYMYLSFFATITSGPIIRFDEFEKGITRPQEIVHGKAIERIVIGLSKKVLIADKIAPLANYYFDGVAAGNNYSTFGFWVGSIAYSLQLYFDFSGYSDMAIGIGGLLGFNIGENFEKPYQASSISEFWRKWHISLTHWFRDYIYIPLGGNRCKVIRHIMNLLIVWLLTGMWHGADWTYIIWGLGFFVLLTIEKYTSLRKKIGSTIIGHVYTLFFVNILWVFFRAENIKASVSFIKGMFGGGNGAIEEKALSFIPFICFTIMLCMPWKKWLPFFEGKGYVRIAKGVLLILLAIMALCASINMSYSPYIYGNF